LKENVSIGSHCKRPGFADKDASTGHFCAAHPGGTDHQRGHGNVRYTPLLATSAIKITQREKITQGEGFTSWHHVDSRIRHYLCSTTKALKSQAITKVLPICSILRRLSLASFGRQDESLEFLEADVRAGMYPHQEEKFVLTLRGPAGGIGY
jgi:hypothetical protein